MGQVPRRLQQANNDPDSAATTVMQELFHTTHRAVAHYRANHHFCPGTWIPARAIDEARTGSPNTSTGATALLLQHAANLP